MRKALHNAVDVITWVLFFVALTVFCYSACITVTSDRPGEGIFLFGYRPSVVLTDSMEPYMMTNSIAITRAVTDISEIAIGDVITFRLEGKDGSLRSFTHRVIAIDDQEIFTKGDNNSEADNLPVSMDMVEAKVVYVINASAVIISWISEKWSSAPGRVLILSFPVTIILLPYFFRFIRKKSRGKQTQPDEAAKTPSDSP